VRGRKDDKSAVVKGEREAWEKERSGWVEKKKKKRKRKIVLGVFFRRQKQK
jgi:hypothetical protein